jgi:hypothetical protein
MVIALGHKTLGGLVELVDELYPILLIAESLVSPHSVLPSASL